MTVIRRSLNVVGRVLVGAGVLLLLFTAFQLWGTGIFESHSQSQLRARIDQELPPAAAARTRAGGGAIPAAPGPARTAPDTAAPADGQPVGVLQIPAIGVDQVVVEGTTTADLRTGPGHYQGTPLPGQLGNAAIAGHRTTYGHPFYNLNELAGGDRVVLTTRQGVFVYRVDAVRVVSPSDTSVLQPADFAELTLTTCNPRYSASQRLVVQGRLASSTFFTPRAAPATTTTVPAPHPAGSHSGDLAGDSSGGNLAVAVAWGAAVAAVAVGAWLLARRVRRRWLVYLAATPVVLVVLFFFFASVTPFLPATF